MKVNNFALALMLSMCAGVLSSCAGDDVFVHRPYEINRESEDFPDGPTLTDGSRVTVCYRNRAATPEQVRDLAIAECGQYGLSAEFEEQHYDDCPIIAPRAAVFTCAGQTANGFDADRSRASQSPFNASPEAPVGSVLAPFRGLEAEDVSTTAKSEPFPSFLLTPAPGH